MKNASLLIFDEPTSALDKLSTETFKRILKEICLEGKIVILITHDDRLLNISDLVIDFN